VAADLFSLGGHRLPIRRYATFARPTNDVTDALDIIDNVNATLISANSQVQEDYNPTGLATDTVAASWRSASIVSELSFPVGGGQGDSQNAAIGVLSAFRSEIGAHRLPMAPYAAFPHASAADESIDLVDSTSAGLRSVVSVAESATAIAAQDTAFSRDLTGLGPHRLPIRRYVAFSRVGQAAQISEFLGLIEDTVDDPTGNYHGPVAESVLAIDILSTSANQTENIVEDLDLRDEYDSGFARPNAFVTAQGNIGVPSSPELGFARSGVLAEQCDEAATLVDAQNVFGGVSHTEFATALDVQSAGQALFAGVAETANFSDLHDAVPLGQLAGGIVESAPAADTSNATGTFGIAVVEVTAFVDASDTQGWTSSSQVAENLGTLVDASNAATTNDGLVSESTTPNDLSFAILIGGSATVVAEVAVLDSLQSCESFKDADVVEVNELLAYHGIEGEDERVEVAVMMDHCTASTLLFTDSEARTWHIASSNRKYTVPGASR